MDWQALALSLRLGLWTVALLLPVAVLLGRWLATTNWRGRPLAELPIEELYEAALVVNLDAAQRLGVTLPPALIARADRLIQPGERTLAPRADATPLPPFQPPARAR